MDVTGEEPAGTGVTTGFLARRLGVSPTTLRSWDRRYGLGPATRVQGRHRRWTPDDVAVVQEMCRLTAAGVPPAEAARAARLRHPPAHATAGPTPDAPARPARRSAAVEEQPAGTRSHSGSGLPLGDVRLECRGLARAAVRMDSGAVREQVAVAVASYGLVPAWETVLTPALRAVGRKWESTGDRYVEVEHLLSWHISAALRSAYVEASRRRPALDLPPTLLACLPGEQHTLPLEALAAVLAERGLPVLMLGAAVPSEALLAAVRRTGPGAVVLWSQSRSTADTALAGHIADTRWGVAGARTRSRVLLCGPGWGLHHTPALLRPRGLPEAVSTVLTAVGARAPAGAAEGAGRSGGT
ncbi:MULTISPECIES: MerR family transcriptional regulator [unclassified Streptomyces]|uniref:MerR family transcriptional regulator n=1 Tax=unclassified Streptomyces TaxID=2593676 RepID=UPI001F049051|nr:MULTISPECIES: MerR family transcriptional regulator [unclassified Streptomyces]MCH0564205.1 MerR family transcriptional regulator [Streptomyces sp. MUM 2J]MCH0568507.1 MerR family transcriptional regulator [Streptomyces sp. MUM 136J]